MHTRQIGEKLFLVDLETGGYKNIFATYVLKGEKAVIVDCGPPSSIPNLLAGLKEINIKPEEVAYVALTHVHVDHGGGTGTLLKSLPNAKVIVHPKGAPHLINPAKLWTATKETLMELAEIFGEPEPVPENRIIIASEGMTFDSGNHVKLKALETPGHASHSLSYYEKGTGNLFPGEAAGAYFSEFDTVLPMTPPPFRPDITLASIEKLISLNPKTLCYAHFGKASDAVNRLKTYSAQIENWLKTATEGIKKGEPEETLRQQLFSEDTTIRKELRQEIVAAINSNLIHKRALFENSVDGFIDFARKNQIQL